MEHKHEQSNSAPEPGVAPLTSTMSTSATAATQRNIFGENLSESTKVKTERTSLLSTSWFAMRIRIAAAPCTSLLLDSGEKSRLETAPAGEKSRQLPASSSYPISNHARYFSSKYPLTPGGIDKDFKKTNNFVNKLIN